MRTISWVPFAYLNHIKCITAWGLVVFWVPSLFLCFHFMCSRYFDSINRLVIFSGRQKAGTWFWSMIFVGCNLPRLAHSSLGVVQLAEAAKASWRWIALNLGSVSLSNYPEHQYNFVPCWPSRTSTDSLVISQPQRLSHPNSSKETNRLPAR